MDKQAQRFELLERIQEGRCVVVHRAFDHETQREVAFKQLREDHSTFPERVAAFSASTKLAARLLHANLVPVIAARRVGTRIFSVSPWLTGVRLSQVPMPLETPLVAAIISQLAEAMTMAHSNATLLRGLNPRDLFLRQEGLILLVDLNKLQEPGPSNPLPAANVRAEVLRYLPMEARSGGAVDTSTDIFCLGALTLELLTGVAPTKEGAVDMKPALISALTAPGATGQLAKLAMTLASPRPDQRPKGVGSLPDNLAPLWQAAGATTRAVISAALARLPGSLAPRPTPPLMPAVGTRPAAPVRATPPRAAAPEAPRTPPAAPAGELPTEEELEKFFEDTTSEVERSRVREAIAGGAAPPKPAADPWGLRSEGRFRSLSGPETPAADAVDNSGFAYVNDSGSAHLGQPTPVSRNTAPLVPRAPAGAGGSGTTPKPRPAPQAPGTTPRPAGPPPRPLGTAPHRPPADTMGGHSVSGVQDPRNPTKR